MLFRRARSAVSRRRLILFAMSVVSACALPIAMAVPAMAYSGPAAASYANSNAYTLLIPSFNDDCTNFVSHALNAGGFSLVVAPGFPTPGYATTSSDAYWFLYYNKFEFNYSHSWTVANDLYNFLLDFYPGGLFEGTFSYNNGKTKAPAFTPNSVVTGDVLFYDWGTGLGISHDSMQVGYGTDQYGYYGNWVDTHTNDHEHIFWTLKDAPGNTNWMTTTVYFMHISSNNH